MSLMFQKSYPKREVKNKILSFFENKVTNQDENCTIFKTIKILLLINEKLIINII